MCSYFVSLVNILKSEYTIFEYPYEKAAARREEMDPMEMMERCMEVMGSGMMGGSAMGVMLVVAAFLLFVWVLGLVALGAMGVWGFKRLSGRPGSR